MKTVLVVIGILVLSATVAHAGHGGEPFAIKSFFVCQNINGPASGAQVDVQGATFNNNPKGVTIGQAIFACVVAKLFPAGVTPIPCPDLNCNEIPPQPPGDQNGITCYAFGPKQGGTSGQPPAYNMLDNLSGDTTDVQQASSVKYICAPSLFTQ
jgi:hypothetical protein